MLHGVAGLVFGQAASQTQILVSYVLALGQPLPRDFAIF